MKKILTKKRPASQPQKGPGLWLSCGERRCFFSAAKPESVNALQKHLGGIMGASKTVLIEFQSLHKWSDEFVWNVFNVLASLQLMLHVIAAMKAFSASILVSPAEASSNRSRS